MEKERRVIELEVMDELEDSGVSAIALVDEPAIEKYWVYMRNQKFVKPSAGESQSDFMGRCVPVLIDEGKDQDQAVAVCISMYEQEFAKEMKFESYTDYPESAKNAAKRALDWAEKNGWGDCGTPIGKARANQLAKGEPISEETIARMASFARHAQNKDNPYSESCGRLMWDAWGGTAGIEWAQNKLESIREKMGTDTSGLAPYVDQVPKKKKHKFLDPNPCWEGYEAYGLKDDGTPNCVPIKSKKEKFLDPNPCWEGYEAYGLKDDGTPNCVPIKAAEECPEATVNIEVNLANRQKAINKAMYGPLDPENPGDYWDKVAARWDVPVEQAKGKICGNCAAFNITKKMKECIASGIGDDAEKVIEAGELGYCEFFDFKCASNRTCLAHVGGGPIEDEVEVVASKLSTIEAKFALEKDKQVVVGPAMVPDMEIFRRDEDGEEYYVKFSAETIAKIQQKFMRETRLGATNLDHDETVDGGSYIFESWLVESESDKANSVYKLGVPVGTWMVKMKVTNPKVWEAVKAGKYNGFSIEGNFIDKEDLEDIEKEKDLIDKIVSILTS
jgi:hypothetical protein